MQRSQGRSASLIALHPARLAMLIAIALQLTACEAVKGIFKAGFWVGVIVVVAVVAGIAFAFSKLRSS